MQYSSLTLHDTSRGDNIDLVFFLLVLFRFLAQLNHTYKAVPYDLKLVHVMSFAILFALVLTLLLLLIKNIPLELEKYKIVILFVVYVLLNAFFVSRFYPPTFVDALSYFLILFFAVTLPRVYISHRYLRYFVMAFLVILILQLIHSFASYGLLFFDSREHRGVIGSFFGHANSASFFISVLLFLLYHTTGRRSVFIKSLLVVLLLLLGTRSVILITFTLLAGLEVSKYFENRRWPVILAFTILAIIIGFYINYVVSEAWSSNPALLSGNSLKWRVRHWMLYTDRINTPLQLLFGKGLASHEAVPLFFYDRFFEVHNDFLKITYDMGLTGLVLFILADISILRFSMARVTHPAYRNGLVAIFLAKVFFMFFDNLVTNFCGTMVYYFIITNYQEIITAIQARNEWCNRPDGRCLL